MPIRSATSLSPSQRNWLISNSTAAAQTTDTTPSDSVDTAPRSRYREPSAALTFMSDFNSQLGISEEMTKEKNLLMTESSHAFFRATPALFYHDLKTTYQSGARLLPNPAPTVSILGDAHALNAGTFRGPDGKAVWGLNDFDQAEAGSPEWDLERLGVSLYVAARSGGQSSDESLKLVESMARSYISSLDEKGPSFLTESESSGEIRKLVEKAGSKTQEKFLKKWTEDGKKLNRDDKLVDPDKKRGAEVERALEKTFPDLKFLDTASKPHSGGSTRGLERYYSLVKSDDREEPWILETKAVLPSPVITPDGDLSRGDGEQVLKLQKEMGSQVDERHRAFRLDKIAFFTREREREKNSLDDSPEELRESAVAIGKLLARAHSSSGADLKGWIGDREETLVDNLGHFTQTYARQVESDFREWQKRYAEG